MTHTCSCAVLIICALLSVCPAGSGSKGKEKREFILLTCKKTHSCRQKSNSKQYSRVATKMRSSGSFFTLYGNNYDLNVKLNSRLCRQVKMNTLQVFLLVSNAFNVKLKILISRPLHMVIGYFFLIDFLGISLHKTEKAIISHLQSSGDQGAFAPVLS